MIAFLTPKTETAYASLKFKVETDSQTRRSPARMTRTQTLDGGVSVDYRTLTDADRTLTVNTYLTRAQAEKFDAMRKAVSLFYLSIDGEFFEGYIQTADNRWGLVSFDFLPIDNSASIEYPEVYAPPTPFSFSYSSAYSDDNAGGDTSDIYFGFNSSWGTTWRTAIIFPCTLAQGSVVSAANLNFINGLGTGDRKATLYFADADSAPALPTSYSGFTSIAKTAGIVWNENLSSFPHVSPDISSILNTVLARPGFSAATIMMILYGGADGAGYDDSYISAATLTGTE